MYITDGDWLLSGYKALWDRDFDILQQLGVNISYTVTGPIQQEWQRQSILGSFNYQIQRYLNHPSILGWSFGSAMNAPCML